MKTPFSIVVLVLALSVSLLRHAQADTPRFIGWVWPNTEATVWLGGGFFPNKGWRVDTHTVPAVYSGTSWTLFGLKGQGATFTTGKAEANTDITGWIADVRQPLNSTQPMLALSGPAKGTQPRLPRAQSTAQPLYAQAAASVLRQPNFKLGSARLTQLLRVDLNGDGIEEVLMCAHSRPDMGKTPEIKVGDYSLAALRFVQNGKVRTVALTKEIYPKGATFAAPNHFEVMACADINRDGKMEIVISTGYYEGFGLQVWEFNGQNPELKLSAGWGA